MARILMVTPAVEFSVSDVSRGYHRALLKAGHEVREYSITKRMTYHARALSEDKAQDVTILSQQATENIVVEALDFDADLVLIVCGLGFHPRSLKLLSKINVPTAIVHTESPYMDRDQVEWDSFHPVARVFTHELYSAERYGWGYLAHAFDPEIHKPEAEVEPDCDVLFIGTAWPERIAFFEQVNWEGINLRLHGIWPQLGPNSPLRKFYTEGVVENELAVKMYQKSKIAVNLHRAHPLARSLNPRAFELAACGVFSLTDAREEGVNIFGESQPTFSTPREFEKLVRFYLAHDDVRRKLAQQACSKVQPETFDHRVTQLFEALKSPAARRYLHKEGEHAL